MTCKDSIELLPWLLNGTLDAQEAAAVRRHLESCGDCREALRENREAWSIFDQHLPTETLVALAYGEPPAGLDPALAERHLASCPQCATELELSRMSRRLEKDERIAVFPVKTSPGADRASRNWRSAAFAAGLAGVVAVGGWLYTTQQVDQLAAQIQKDRVAEAPVRPAPAPTPPRSGDTATSQIAALMDRVNELTRDQEELEQRAQEAQAKVAELRNRPDPMANPWLSGAILPTEDVVRSSGGARDLSEIPAHASLAMLPLTALHRETGAHRSHEAVILDSKGSTVQKGQIERSQNGYYTLALYPVPPKGTYTINIYGIGAGGREELTETYGIEIQ